MSYIEARIASADDVRAAHEAGLLIQHTVEYDEFSDGWRLQVLFQKNGEYFSRAGRLFKAPTQESAKERMEHQFERLIGISSRIAEKFSKEYLAAREALEAKIQKIWDTTDPKSRNLIKPGIIKVNWSRREPLLKVMRFTSLEDLHGKYDPELARFIEISKSELKNGPTAPG